MFIGASTINYLTSSGPLLSLVFNLRSHLKQKSLSTSYTNIIIIIIITMGYQTAGSGTSSCWCTRSSKQKVAYMA